MSFKIYSLMLMLVLMGHTFSVKARELRPVSKTNLIFAEEDGKALSTGFAVLNHYNADFDQSFYSLSLNGERRALGGILKADAFGLLQVSGDGNSTFSIQNLHYTKKIGKSVSLDIGRKIADWSYNEEFKPAAFWNNAWDYSKAFPELEGLFGAFFNFKTSKSTKAFVFISPLSVPKIASHSSFGDDGGVRARTPWFELPPEQVTSAGAVYQTRYFLETDIADLVLNPQFGFSVDHQSQSTGVFGKLSYLYGPDRDLDLAINFKLRPSDPEVPVDLTVTPQVSNVHRIGFELGHMWSDSSDTVVSANFKLRDQNLPIDDAGGEQSYLGLSSGGVFQVLHHQNLFKERVKMTLHFTENTKITSNANGELGPVLLDSLSSPFRYNRGLGANFDFKVGLHSKISIYGYQDFLAEGVLGAVAYSFRHKKLNLRAGINFVEALSSESKGFYRDFRQNDSYNLGASYVF